MGHLQLFRSDRRRIFREMILLVKHYFNRVETNRRLHMQRSGNMQGELMVRNTLVFTRALLELRAALILHYVSVSAASKVVQFACAEIEACLSSPSEPSLEST